MRCTIAGITAQGIRRARETILILVFAPMSKKYKKDKEHWGKSASFSPSGWSRCAGPRYVTRRYVWIIISWPLSSVTYQLQAGYNRTRPTRGMFVTFGNIFCFAFGLLVPNECCFVAHIELFIEVGKTEKVPWSPQHIEFDTGVAFLRCQIMPGLLVAVYDWLTFLAVIVLNTNQPLALSFLLSTKTTKTTTTKTTATTKTQQHDWKTFPAVIVPNTRDRSLFQFHQLI